MPLGHRPGPVMGARASLFQKAHLGRHAPVSARSVSPNTENQGRTDNNLLPLNRAAENLRRRANKLDPIPLAPP